MFQLIQGRVLRHDQALNNLVVETSSGFALGIFYESDKPISGDVRMWLWPVFNIENGYTFYGFPDLVSRRTAELLWSQVDGLGPKGASLLCQRIPDVVQLAAMSTAEMCKRCKGLGKKAEDVLKVLGAQKAGPTLTDWLRQVGIADPDPVKLAAAKEAGRNIQEQVTAYLSLR